MYNTSVSVSRAIMHSCKGRTIFSARDAAEMGPFSPMMSEGSRGRRRGEGTRLRGRSTCGSRGTPRRLPPGGTSARCHYGLHAQGGSRHQLRGLQFVPTSYFVSSYVESVGNQLERISGPDAVPVWPPNPTLPDPRQARFLAGSQWQEQPCTRCQGSVPVELIDFRQRPRRNTELLGNTCQAFTFPSLVRSPPEAFVRRYLGDGLLISIFSAGG